MDAEQIEPIDALQSTKESVASIARSSDKLQKFQQLCNKPGYTEELGICVSEVHKLLLAVKPELEGTHDTTSAANVLLIATGVVSQPEAAARYGEHMDEMCAKRALAKDVVDAFQAMQEYCKIAAQRLELLDPVLCNNTGMVERCDDWAESIWVAELFLTNEPMMQGLSCFAALVRRAKRMSQEFSTMLEEANEEVFLKVTRLICLAFVAEPDNTALVVKSMLPHGFHESLDGVPCLGEALQTLVMRYHMAVESLQHELGTNAWQFLIETAIGSSARAQDMAPETSDQAHETAVELLQELEALSQELQRCSFTRWTQFLALVSHCAT